MAISAGGNRYSNIIFARNIKCQITNVKSSLNDKCPICNPILPASNIEFFDNNFCLRFKTLHYTG